MSLSVNDAQGADAARSPPSLASCGSYPHSSGTTAGCRGGGENDGDQAKSPAADHALAKGLDDPNCRLWLNKEIKKMKLSEIVLFFFLSFYFFLQRF